MATKPSPGSLAEQETPQTWRAFIRTKLIEWGPIDKNLFILQMTPLMPAGYAWFRYVADAYPAAVREDWEDDEIPRMTTREDAAKAQRFLVLWLLRQLRREGMLIEENGMIACSRAE